MAQRVCQLLESVGMLAEYIISENCVMARSTRAQQATVGLKIKVSRHRAIKAVVGDKSSRAITAPAIAISGIHWEKRM
jgi:hypothetical protein